jgi:citrate synthase
MVGKMIENIKSNIDYKNEEQLKNYIYKLFKKEVFDKKGLVYGMGHAIYTLSDPRAEVLKEKAYQLAIEKDALDEYNLYTNIEKFTKQISKELKGPDFAICANVDLYSGFVYELLGIPNSIFTPLFALSRIASWNAHRIEQLTSERKIIRPAYKAVDKDGKLIL